MIYQDTKRLEQEEKRIGIEVIHHLREVDARKLFASLKYSSLFLYCTEELSYSEGGAQRRISTMRLLRDVPEYESKLKEGAVSVSTLSRVQSFLVQEKRRRKKTYSRDEKLELLGKIEGTSSKQTERVLAIVSPQSARIEKTRVLNEEETEIRFTVNREVMRKLERLKNLLGHKSKAQSYAGLVEELADLALKRLDPLGESSLKKSDLAKNAENSPSLPPMEMGKASSEKHTRYVPAQMKHLVWKRDQGRCTFVEPKTGRRCESRHALQLEHVRPFAMGGASSIENLTLHCVAHNQLAAIQAYGLEKMQQAFGV
jgi:hypothetical protein